MDETDRQILNILQSDFPIDCLPYGILGQRLGITEVDALNRVRALMHSGIIRRIGPSFDTRRLGHMSTLVAAKVPHERLDDVAAIVSSFPEVTHNYGRDAEYNLWFTIVSGSPALVEETLDSIRSESGIADMQALPAEEMFKIRVEFEF